MMFLGHESDYWIDLDSILKKYNLTEKDFPRIDAALSKIGESSTGKRIPAPGDIVHVRAMVVSASIPTSKQLIVAIVNERGERVTPCINWTEIAAIESRSFQVGDFVNVTNSKAQILAIDGDHAWVKYADGERRIVRTYVLLPWVDGVAS